MQKIPVVQIRSASECPYCSGDDVIKSGKRKNKFGAVNLFYCNHCRKKFTPLLTKHKSFPLRVILDSISFYNCLYSFEEAADIVAKKYGLKISGENVRRWTDDFREYAPFLRMREFAAKKFERKDIIERTHMMHGQIFDFAYHRAKLELLLNDDFKHYKFKPLQHFLDLVSAECPHQIFRESKVRASEFRDIFNLDKVRITPKVNAAVKNARMILQTVTNNKLRHQILQEYMVVNDSVTVAAEVPVLLDLDDIRHFKNELGFEAPISINEGEVITGHIDLLQVRNGAIYILDYKPSAQKEKPISQLTLYALALSRLTTLRLYHFKCGWFDKDIYYEFFPLHVVYKKKAKRSRLRPSRTASASKPENG